MQLGTKFTAGALLFLNAMVHRSRSMKLRVGQAICHHCRYHRVYKPLGRMTDAQRAEYEKQAAKAVAGRMGGVAHGGATATLEHRAPRVAARAVAASPQAGQGASPDADQARAELFWVQQEADAVRRRLKMVELDKERK